MHSSANALQSHERAFFKLENAIKLLRPHDIVRRYAPGEIADASQVLAFCQKCFTPRQLLFRLFAIRNIGSGRIPAKNSSMLIQQWVVADKKPAILAVLSQYPLLIFERNGTRQRQPALFAQSLHIVPVENT